MLQSYTVTLLQEAAGEAAVHPSTGTGSQGDHSEVFAAADRQ